MKCNNFDYSKNYRKAFKRPSTYKIIQTNFVVRVYCGDIDNDAVTNSFWWDTAGKMSENNNM